MLKLIIPSAVVALAGAAANGAFFSYASDVDHTSWTWAGAGAAVADADDPIDPQVLLIDDDNGPALPSGIQCEWEADLVLTGATASPQPDGTVIYSYRVDGTFGFFGPAGPILTATVTNGLMSVLGIGGAWFTTATIQANDRPLLQGAGADVTYTWHGPDDPVHGLFTGQSVGLDDAAFTLTVLNSGRAAGVVLGTDLLPAEAWQSEGSYSGSAHFIPGAPTAATMLVGLGYFARRRRA